MAQYEVTLCDRTGVRIGPLPPYGGSPLQFQRVLSGAGTATIVPRLTLPLISGRENRQRLTAWGSEIIIERVDGPGQQGLVWEGPVTKPHADLDGDSLSITAVEPWGWLETERTIQGHHEYGGRDQLDVARDLIAAYTTGLGTDGDIRMTLGGGKSGVQVSEIYQPSDNKFVGQAVEDLAGAVNGFDFTVESHFDQRTGKVMRTWVPYYPHKGQTLTQKLQSGLGGLRAASIEEATQICTRVVGSGAVTLKSNAAAALESVYGIHTDSISLTDANGLAKLQAQTDQYRKDRTPPVPIVSWQYKVSEQTPYGFIDLGDSVPVLLERGWAFYEGLVRVISTTTAVDAAGNELVTCNAAGVPGGIS